ncbi:SRPBCC family protein [Spirilliplanes yamanashiensis]|uniref:Activator of HSP90 ATPase n=1 Tax=Spirilliplanes yamanashiensis TaxID=42233 RepID=A0A8J3YDV4_9ACTN|nr:SRPBCC family protein [Spirilliplanes yamanashiensis]MDP9816588.1 uncharacterized protein YndB with AHSA1/START domain [Spirilliplanes yamanashiensis]GIJ06114.1 activator of HSP90 ATPase [Spirilliplanes yamanashiensis]
MIQGEQQIDAVTRTVSAREVPAGAVRVVSLSQAYDTGLDDLWDAVTSAERLPRWFLPVTGELREGGRYQFEGNAGGTIERCAKPALSATWEFGGQISWVEVRLVAEGPERTRLELDHLALADDKTWAEYGPGATGVGWDGGLMGLHLYLSGDGSPVDREAVAAWSASDDGKRFVTASSERWYEAAVAGGEDPAVARAAADRTTAAYTGAPA